MRSEMRLKQKMGIDAIAERCNDVAEWRMRQVKECDTSGGTTECARICRLNSQME